MVKGETLAGYVGIMDGSNDVWAIRIPDCPSAYGGGATPELAIASAIAGLPAWAESSQKEGAVLPRARSIAEIIEPGDDAPDLQNNEMIVQIPFCLIPAGRSAPM